MRPARRVAPVALAIAAAAALAGCGLSNPYTAASTTASTTTSTAPPWNPGEGGPGTTQASTPPATVHASPSPEAALRAYASIYINWTWQTVAAAHRRLATLAVGAQHQAELQTAAQDAGDVTLLRAKVTNRGRVVAVTPDPGHANVYVVVTQETTGSQARRVVGTPNAFHVTLGTVQRTDGGWAVSAWRPQS